MKNINAKAIHPDDVFCPLVKTPFGRVPLIGCTMTNEREKELARKYPAKEVGK